MISFLGDSNSMSMAAISDDDQVKSGTPTLPPPAAHCRLTPTTSISSPSTIDDPKPLDLSIKSAEQPLNLSSKRKRNPPMSLSKRNHALSSSTPAVPPATTTTTTTTTTNPAVPSSSSSSSMFIPFYALTPFLDPTNAVNQQEMLQQLQSFYCQIQEKFLKHE